MSIYSNLIKRFERAEENHNRRNNSNCFDTENSIFQDDHDHHDEEENIHSKNDDDDDVGDSPNYSSSHHNFDVDDDIDVDIDGEDFHYNSNRQDREELIATSSTASVPTRATKTTTTPYLIYLLRSSDWSLALRRLTTHPQEAQWKGYNNETTLHAAFTNSMDYYGDDILYRRTATLNNHIHNEVDDDFNIHYNNDDMNNIDDKDNDECLNMHVPLSIIQQIITINGNQIANQRMDGSTSVLDLILSSWCDVIRILVAGIHTDGHDGHSYGQQSILSNPGDWIVVKDDDLDLLPSIYEYELRKKVIQYIMMTCRNSRSSNVNETSDISCSNSNTMEHLWNWIILSNKFLCHYNDLSSVMRQLDVDKRECYHNNNGSNFNDNSLNKSQNMSNCEKRKRDTSFQNDESSTSGVNKVVTYVQFFISIVEIILLSPSNDHINNKKKRNTDNANKNRKKVKKESTIEEIAPSYHVALQQQFTPTLTSTTKPTTINMFLLHVLLQIYNIKKSTSIPILILKLAIKSCGSKLCEAVDEEGRTPLIIAITSNECHWNHSHHSHYYHYDDDDSDSNSDDESDNEDNNYSDDDNDDDIMNSLHHKTTTLSETIRRKKTRKRIRKSQQYYANKIEIMKALLDQSPGSASIPHGITKRLPLHLALDYYIHNIDSTGCISGNANCGYGCQGTGNYISTDAGTSAEFATTTPEKIRHRSESCRNGQRCMKKRLTWDSGVSLLVDDSPHVLCEKDVKTGLFPFALAAAVYSREMHNEGSRNESLKYDSYDGEKADGGEFDDEDNYVCLDTVYKLLLSNPTVLSSYIK